MPPAVARTLGIAFCLVITVATAWGWSRRPTAAGVAISMGEDRASLVGGGAVDWPGGPPTSTTTDPTRRHRPGDPVFAQSVDQQPVQIGHLAMVEPVDGAASRVTIQWYVAGDAAVPPSEWQLTSHRTTGGLDEVAAMMLPPGKRRQIADRVTLAMRQHGEAIAETVTPLITDVVRRSLPLIEAELGKSISRHRNEIDALTQRYQREIVAERLMPLVRREVLPIIRKHGQPPAEEIGREIWARTPVWRFGIRAIYDKTPLPEKDMLREEFDRFVEKDVLPVIEDHADELVVAIQRSLMEASANPRVREAIRQSAEQIAADPEARELIATVMREAIVENQTLRELWGSVWSDPRTRTALEGVSQRIEPVLRGIGDDFDRHTRRRDRPRFCTRAAKPNPRQRPTLDHRNAVRRGWRPASDSALGFVPALPGHSPSGVGTLTCPVNVNIRSKFVATMKPSLKPLVPFLFAGLVGLPLLTLISRSEAVAQQPPYDVAPAIEPPYHQVRYEGSSQPGRLNFPVRYTIWLPPKVQSLRGVLVHQHGCGEGSCKSGLTGAHDLHWQALAAQHDCALLAASYEQPQDADCQLWCDPRNGSGDAFENGLADLATATGHPELVDVPWALWGHSGGGVWAGTMTMLHPERVAAAWLRSGVPLLTPQPNRPSIKVVPLPVASVQVPMMLNLGTQEGVTVTEGRFTGVWPRVQAFFDALRPGGTPIGIAVDPKTGHECGNQRYLAIPWFDAVLAERLPTVAGQPLNSMSGDAAWLAPWGATEAMPQDQFDGDRDRSIWLPNGLVAQAWRQYVLDTAVADQTPPPMPDNLEVFDGELHCDCRADLQSGIAHFLIFRDGEQIAQVPARSKNPYGRPLFQGLQYSDTPVQPLRRMVYLDKQYSPEAKYEVVSINTVGLRSGN